MMRSRLSILFVLAVGSVGFGCRAVDDSEPAIGGSDTDGDKDTVGDSEVDGDSDTDGDTDVDSDGESDGQSDSLPLDTAYSTEISWDTDAYIETVTNTKPLDAGVPCGCFGDASWDAGPCADWELDIQFNPSHIMILQDVSDSMAEGTPMKWVHVRSALVTLMSLYGFTDLLGLGFDVFPDKSDCFADEPPVIDSAPYNGQNIFDLLPLIELSQSTPLFMAMGNFLDDSYAPVFLSEEHPRYLIIVSDGKDSCGNETDHIPDEQYGANAAQLGFRARTLLEDQQVFTIAIGFGDAADPEQLNAIAANGGTDYNAYLQADDSTELEAIFQELAAYTISCEFELNPVMRGDGSSVIIDYSEIEFFMDGNPLMRDPGCSRETGWDWVAEKTTVRLCGEPCQVLRKSSASSITAEFSCVPVVDLI